MHIPFTDLHNAPAFPGMTPWKKQIVRERHADALASARRAVAKGQRAYAVQCLARARFYRLAIATEGRAWSR